MKLAQEKHHEFAIIIQPGLEKAAKAELQYWLDKLKFPINNMETSFGVIEFEADLANGLMLNQVLKCPTRIIYRIKSMRCRDFPKLFKIMSKIDWQLYGAPFSPKWEISTKQSRLSIKKRIMETCDDAYKHYLKSNALEANTDQEQKVLLRLLDDTLTVSIDTSGTDAYKRGIRIHTEEAPMRENIASALLWQMFADEIESGTTINLLDPMTGSGCFPIEAATLLKPQPSKDFPYSYWKQALTSLPTVNKEKIEGKFIGQDINEKAILSAKKNKIELLKQFPEVEEQNLDFSVQDFFLQTKEIFGDENYAIIINPPYFQRIKMKDDKPTGFFRKLFLSLDNHTNAIKAGIIVPKIKGWNMPELKHWEKVQVTKTSNGGIPIFFYELKRKS